jgi:hypothetical protein
MKNLKAAFISMLFVFGFNVNAWFNLKKHIPSDIGGVRSVIAGTAMGVIVTYVCKVLAFRQAKRYIEKLNEKSYIELIHAMYGLVFLRQQFVHFQILTALDALDAAIARSPDGFRFKNTNSIRKALIEVRYAPLGLKIRGLVAAIIERAKKEKSGEVWNLVNYYFEL